MSDGRIRDRQDLCQACRPVGYAIDIVYRYVSNHQLAASRSKRPTVFSSGSNRMGPLQWAHPGVSRLCGPQQQAGFPWRRPFLAGEPTVLQTFPATP
jgi:hypothetical protein